MFLLVVVLRLASHVRCFFFVCFLGSLPQSGVCLSFSFVHSRFCQAPPMLICFYGWVWPSHCWGGGPLSLVVASLLVALFLSLLAASQFLAWCSGFGDWRVHSVSRVLLEVCRWSLISACYRSSSAGMVSRLIGCELVFFGEGEVRWLPVGLPDSVHTVSTPGQDTCVVPLRPHHNGHHHYHTAKYGPREPDIS